MHDVQRKDHPHRADAPQLPRGGRATLGIALAACLGAGAILAAPATARADDDKGLTAKDIERVVDPSTAAVRRCYARHAMSQRHADGKFAVDLVILPDGKVRRARVDAPKVRGAAFGRCVSKIAGKWEFPESVGTTRVTYPFHFVHTHARGAGPTYARRRSR